MHRSGTSAFARALQVFGVSLGNHLLPSHPCNPKGFFEDAEVYAFNKALLGYLDQKWYDFPPPSAQRQRALIKGGWGSAAIDLLQQKTAGIPVFGLKDPRLSILLPFWRPLLAKIDRQTQCLICLRNPDSVAHSLHRRDNMPAAKACALWIAHTLGALTGSTGLPRLCVGYEALLRDPVRQLTRLGRELHLTPDINQQHVFLEEFLDARLCHHNSDDGSSPAGNDPHTKLARDIHTALCTDDTSPLSPDDPAVIRLTGQWLLRFRALPLPDSPYAYEP
ncbi:MAG: glycosyl transferase family 1 [Desulfovibrio sp.]|nr:glycosyl transferase family 1 [Desulfovibrio sp.]